MATATGAIGSVRVRQLRRFVGSDRTLAVDVASVEEIERYLRRAAERIARRVRAQGHVARGVRVRLKTRASGCSQGTAGRTSRSGWWRGVQRNRAQHREF